MSCFLRIGYVYVVVNKGYGREKKGVMAGVDRCGIKRGAASAVHECPGCKFLVKMGWHSIECEHPQSQEMR